MVDGADDGVEVDDGAALVDGASDGIEVVDGANDGVFDSSSQNGKSSLLPFPFPPLPLLRFRRTGLLSVAIEITHEMQTNRIIDGFLMSLLNACLGIF